MPDNGAVIPALEVRHLLMVDAIAETGTVTAAAGRLNVTQSALSHQLRDLESRLRVQLFERQGRRMVLTPAGLRVRQSARVVLDDIRNAELELKGLAGTRRVIRLCTQCNTGYHWLPPLLKDYQQRHPAVDIQICIEATRRPIEALQAREIDLAIVTNPLRDRRLITTTLFEDELMAVVAPSHPWASKSWVRPSEFATEHVVIYSADRSNSYTFKYVLGPAGVEPARVSEVPLTEAILELVKAGLGVGVVAGWAVEPAVAAGQVAAIRISKHGVFRPWTAVTRPGTSEAPWMRDFIDLLARRGLPGQYAASRRRREQSAKRSGGATTQSATRSASRPRSSRRA
jgi:LysR family transcriptional regulator, regulator for metE and metH